MNIVNSPFDVRAGLSRSHDFLKNMVISFLSHGKKALPTEYISG